MRMRFVGIILFLGMVMWITGCSDGNDSEEEADNQAEEENTANENQAEDNQAGDDKQGDEASNHAEEGDTEDDEGEFLTVETSKGELTAELETPNDDSGQYPVMIIIPGSGPMDRNGNSKAMPGKNDSLKMVAEQLAGEGIASIRYDKRGVKENQSANIPEEKLTFRRFVKDAEAWVDMLGDDERFSQIGIIGHSQGSLVGMVAGQETDVAAFISLEGAGRPINQVMYEQFKGQLPDDLLAESKDILDKLKQGKQVEVDGMSEQLQSQFRPSVQSFLSTWMQFDPAEEIAKLDIPVLIINGEHDIQTSEEDAEILHQATDEESSLWLIPKMNHVLKEAPENRQENIQTYSDPELPLADGLMEDVMAFLDEEDFH